LYIVPKKHLTGPRIDTFRRFTVNTAWSLARSTAQENPTHVAARLYTRAGMRVNILNAC
jgi:hypothetical protein